MADIIEDTDANGLSTPYTISVGDSFFGSLDGNEDDYDDYIRFNANKGDIIRLTAQYVSGDEDLEPPEVLLLGTEGDALGQTGKGRITNGETYEVFETGVHYAKVSTSGNTEFQDYRLDLTLEDTPDFFDYTKQLDTISGAIFNPNFPAEFSVNIRDEGTYVLTYDPFNDENENPSNLTNWAATLLNSTGQIIAEGTDSGSDNEGYFYFESEAWTSLLLTVSSQNSDTGNFSLSLGQVHSVNSVTNSYGSLVNMEGDEFANALIGSSGKQTIYGFAGDDIIYAEDGNDRVWDGKGGDFVELGDGDDYVRVGSGQDSFFGGAGNDHISYYDSKNGVTVDLESNAVSGSWASNDVILSFENASGSKTGDDVMTGTSGSNRFKTYAGDDRVYAGSGSDEVHLGDGDDYVRVGGGEESFFGGSGKDYISYYDSRNGVTLDLGANEASGSWANNDIIDGFESASGSKTGDDTVTGSSQSNTIRTYGGDDKVYAGLGEDRVYLGDGDDYVRAGGGEESFYGGSGSDYISYYSSRNGVTLDLDANEASGSWASNDTISGFENASGSKTGSDTLLGTDGANRMRGYGGDDLIDGRRGNDQLFGGDGDDTIIGGAGRDEVTGGTGADVFVFDSATNYAGYDKIMDFEAGIDTILLIGFGFDETTDFSRFNDSIDERVSLDFDGNQGIKFENDVSLSDIVDSFDFA